MSKRAYDKIAEGPQRGHRESRVARRSRAKLYVPPEIDVRATRQWEEGRCRPLGAVRAYLMIIDRDPKHVRSSCRDLRGARRLTAFG
jgi:putative transcriptional regulator